MSAARDAKRGRARTGVRPDLGLAGANRLGDGFEAGFGSRLFRLGQMPRARRHGTAPLLEEPLHEPVLETVERYDGKTATGLQHLLCGRQPALTTLQLLVQIDAYRLEGPGRRDLPRAGPVAPRPA